jgi:hypothetical protein
MMMLSLPIPRESTSPSKPEASECPLWGIATLTCDNSIGSSSPPACRGNGLRLCSVERRTYSQCQKSSLISPMFPRIAVVIGGVDVDVVDVRGGIVGLMDRQQEGG